MPKRDILQINLQQIRTAGEARKAAILTPRPLPGTGFYAGVDGSRPGGQRDRVTVPGRGTIYTRLTTTGSIARGGKVSINYTRGGIPTIDAMP